jgi:hypothetical protein
MTDQQTDWAVLLKFGKREHMEALREQGLLHLMPQSYFAKLEGDGVRSDGFEGTDRIYLPSDLVQLTIEGPCDDKGTIRKIVIPSSDLAGPLSITLTTTPRFNLYCMHGLRRPIERIDERNLGFGDSFVLILNTQAFLDRALAATRAAHFSMDYRFVEYCDLSSHSGDWGVFRKPHEFAYQSEFRLAVTPGLIEPLQLSLGSLADITSPVLPLSEINQIVDFTEASAEAAGISV